MRHHPQEASLGLPAIWPPQGQPPPRTSSGEGLPPSLPCASCVPCLPQGKCHLVLVSGTLLDQDQNICQTLRSSQGRVQGKVQRGPLRTSQPLPEGQDPGLAHLPGPWEGGTGLEFKHSPLPLRAMRVPCLWLVCLSIHQISPGHGRLLTKGCRCPSVTFTTQPSVPWPLGNTTPAPSLCPSQPTARVGSALVTSTHPHSTGSGGGCHSHRPRAWTTLRPPAAPRAPAPGGCAATIRYPRPRPTPGKGQQPPCPCTLPLNQPRLLPQAGAANLGPSWE